MLSLPSYGPNSFLLTHFWVWLINEFPLQVEKFPASLPLDFIEEDSWKGKFFYFETLFLGPGESLKPRWANVQTQHLFRNSELRHWRKKRKNQSGEGGGLWTESSRTEIRHFYRCVPRAVPLSGSATSTVCFISVWVGFCFLWTNDLTSSSGQAWSLGTGPRLACNVPDVWV